MNIIDIATQFQVNPEHMLSAILQSQFKLSAINAEVEGGCHRVFIKLPDDKFDDRNEAVFVVYEDSGFTVVCYTKSLTGKSDLIPELFRFDEGKDGYIGKERRIFTEEEIARSSVADFELD